MHVAGFTLCGNTFSCRGVVTVELKVCRIKMELCSPYFKKAFSRVLTALRSREEVEEVGYANAEHAISDQLFACPAPATPTSAGHSFF